MGIVGFDPQVNLDIEPDEPLALLALLGHGDPMVRWQAAESLALVAQDRQSRTAPFWTRAIGRDTELDVSIILDGLASALDSDDAAVRTAVVDALGAWRHTGCLPYLRAALSDGSDQVRAAAASALGSCADIDSIDGLVALAWDDESVWVRTAAIDALGTLEQVHIAPALCDMMQTLEKSSQGGEPESAISLVKTRVLTALGRLDHGRAKSMLLSYVEQDQDPTLQWIAARGLANIGGSEAIVALQALLGDDTAILGRTMHDVATQAIAAIKRRDQGLVAWLRKMVYRVTRGVRRLFTKGR